MEQLINNEYDEEAWEIIDRLVAEEAGGTFRYGVENFQKNPRMAAFVFSVLASKFPDDVSVMFNAGRVFGDNPNNSFSSPIPCRMLLSLRNAPALRQPFRIDGDEVEVIFGADDKRRFRPDTSKKNLSDFVAHSEMVEPETRFLIETFLPRDGVFYDIGANWGCFSLYAASKPDFEGSVYAFEAAPKTYADLTAIVRTTGTEDVIRCMDFGLSDRNSRSFLMESSDGHPGLTCLSDHGIGGLLGVQWAPSEDESEFRTIDGLDGLPPPDFMKVDVEGHEHEVFLGGERTLKEAKPFIVFENWVASGNLDHGLAPCRYLEGLGYKLFFVMWERYSFLMRRTLASRDVGAFRSHRVTMSLCHFYGAERCLYPMQANIFACHESRLHEVLRYCLSGT